MNNESKSKPASQESDQDDLHRLLLDNIAPIEMPPVSQAGMRQNLLARVAQSVTEHVGLTTVRSKDGIWQDLTAGVRFKLLWNGTEGSSVLIEFSPGAGLVPHRHQWLEEGIVLQGGLQMGDLELGPLDYHVSPAGSRHAGIQSQQGALAYLRGTSLGDHGGVLRELLGGLLPGANGTPQTVFINRIEDWQELAPGVQKKVLWLDQTQESSFYRLTSGARLPGHSHHAAEECMILQGEVFLGDILLSAGDYQIASAGSAHGEITCDTDVLLFVRLGAGEKLERS